MSFTNVRSLLGAFVQCLNLIDRDTQQHHEQTAFFAFQLARAMKADRETIHLTLYTALLYDIGSVVRKDAKTLKASSEGRKTIAATGANLIREVEELAFLGSTIELSQNSYLENRALLGEGNRLDSLQAVHLADFVTSRLTSKTPVLNQVEDIVQEAEVQRGTEFSSKVLDALSSIRNLEVIWFDTVMNPRVLAYLTGTIQEVSLDELVYFTRLVSRLIDYRSPFTAMHSAGVAATARELAKYAGLSADEVKMMEVAGNLHDIGKLRVPNAILEKPGKLAEEEFNVMREHTYYTRLILSQVYGFEKIADWAAYHHEKLNGKGYPFHLTGEQLDVGARIMAVADIFSAITEDRPYRSGMRKEHALDVLKDNVERGEICGWVVKILEEHFDEVNQVRESESRAAGQRYYQSLGK